MTKDQTNFRNNPSRCDFNNFGFCKFKVECRKQHAKNVCKIQNCDGKFANRHPKPCKDKEKCRFAKKNICAFNHEALEEAFEEVHGQAKMPSDEIVELKKQIIGNEDKYERKIKGLKDEINIEKNKNEVHQNAIKDAIRANCDLEKTFKNEMKQLNLKMKKLESSNEHLQSKLSDSENTVNEQLTHNTDIINQMLEKEIVMETKVKE